MKRCFFAGCIIVLVFVFTGCTKTIELTDDENYIIAEYAAELLLKYDRNTDMKYYDDTVTTEATPLDADKTTEELTTEEVTEESTTHEEVTTEEPKTEQQWTDVSGITANETTDFDIAGYVGVDTASIRYAYYMLLDKYPSYDQDGIYMEIVAPKGYKLLVLKFDVENKTNDKQNIDMYSKDVEYSIIVNDSKKANQMLTILIDDLYTYQATIDASMRQEAVLLFQVSESVADKISDLKLQINYMNDSKVIQLQ